MTLDDELKKETKQYEKYDTQYHDEIEKAVAVASADEEEEEEISDLITNSQVKKTKPLFPFFNEHIERLDLYDPQQAAEYDEFMKNVKGVGRIQQLHGAQGW